MRAFAELAEGERAEELRKFAGVFSPGKDEAVSARVKRVLSRCPAQPAHPAGLRKSLVTIASGLSACSAKKQAGDFQAILSLFEGFGMAPVDSFVKQIVAALAAPSVKTSGRRKREQPADHVLAGQLADELAKAVLDPDAFERVVERLRDSKRVSTPTLGVVANRFLANSKSYSGRKAAIDDIIKRQKLDARSHARGKALDRIGV